MNRMTLIIGVLCLLGGLGLGTLIHSEPQGQPGNLNLGGGNGASTESPKGVDPAGEPVHARPFGIKSTARTPAELAARIRELEAQLAAKTVEAAGLASALDELKGKRAATLKAVREHLDTMGKKGGLAAYGDPAAWSQLISDLRSLGSEGVNLAIGMLSSDNPNLRVMAAKILEDLSDPRAVPDLEKMALEDSDEMARNMASHALAFMKSQDAIPALRDLYEKSENLGVRINSLAGLAMQGDPNGIRDTAAYIADENNSRQMRQALMGILAVRSDPHLMPVAAQAAQSFGESEQLMALIVSYYGNVGAAAAPALQAIVDNNSFSAAIREQARQALLQ